MTEIIMFLPFIFSALLVEIGRPLSSTAVDFASILSSLSIISPSLSLARYLTLFPSLSACIAEFRSRGVFHRRCPPSSASIVCLPQSSRFVAGIFSLLLDVIISCSHLTVGLSLPFSCLFLSVCVLNCLLLSLSPSLMIVDS